MPKDVSNPASSSSTRKFKLYCPHCEKKIPINKESIYKSANKIMCPLSSCKKLISIRTVDILCPCCGKSNEVILPEDVQPVETYSNQFRNDTWPDKEETHILPSELETTCTSCGKLFVVLFWKGRNTAKFDRITNKESIIDQVNPFLRLVTWAGKLGERWFEERETLRSGPYTMRRVKELVFCVLAGLFLGGIYPFLVWKAADCSNATSIGGNLLFGFLLGGIFYFFLITMREIMEVFGELENKVDSVTKNTLYNVLKRMYSYWVTILAFVLLTSLSFLDELSSSGLDISTHEQRLRWIDNIAWMGWGVGVALGGQMVVGYGVLLAVLWNSSKHRAYVSIFKEGFLSVQPQIEKMGEIATHIVIFTASTVFLTYVFMAEFFSDSTIIGIYEADPDEIRLLYSWCYLIGIIGPLVCYFLYLSKFVNNIKAVEMEKIAKQLRELELKEQRLDEQNYLLTKRNQVENSCKWIVSVGYGSRLLLLLIVALMTYFVGGIS